MIRTGTILAQPMRGWRWWTGELRALLPRGGPDWTMSADGAVHPPPGFRSGAVRLCLDPALVLVRTLKLPAAAEAHLDAILAHHIGLLVPVDPASLAFAARVTARDGGTIAVAVAIVRRATLAAAQQAVAQAGGRLVHAVARLAETEVELLHPTAAPPRPRPLRWLDAALAVLLAATIAGLLLRATTREQDLVAEINQLRPAAAAVTALRREADTLAQRAAGVQALLSAPPAPLILAELTRLLPDDTWLSSLQIQGGSIAMAGTSPRPAALIGLLDASPYFADARFRAAVTVGADGVRQHFDLTAKMRGAP